MAEKKICAVSTCPAYAEIGQSTCQPHRDAIVVTSGHGAKDRPCVTCTRAIKKGEWVWREMRLKVGGKPGEVYGWAHVACEPITPRPTRQQLRDSEKPLFTEA